MSYPIFDLHWHARDEEQSAKETIARSLAVAEASGIIGIAAMPNTKRPLISLERCQEYLAIADREKSPVKFYVHIGLTPDPEQVKRAVDAWRREPRIIGMKAYWGKSTGDLTIRNEDQQRKVLETLSEEYYDGVLISHCEKESCMNDKLYTSSDPRIWSRRCRPEAAEMSSFDDIAGFAEDVFFPGTLHIAHVSTAYAVDKIHNYRGKVKLSCGVTPHHLFLSDDYLDRLGAQAKCNPALREEATRKGLEKRLWDGRINIIESDHANHCVEDKQGEEPASGIPVGVAWPETLGALIRRGMPSARIKALVCENPVNLFRSGDKLLDLEIPDRVRVNMDKLRLLRESYPLDVSKYIG